MTWEETTMSEAIQFIVGKTIDKETERRDTPDCEAEVIYFTDGSALACMSKWRGPYSSVTPDIDADPPIWWIGRP